jgi:hypothetical protein
MCHLQRSFTDTYLLSSLFFDLTSPRVLDSSRGGERNGHGEFGRGISIEISLLYGTVAWVLKERWW